MIFWKSTSSEKAKLSPTQVTVNGSGLSSATAGEMSSFSIYAPNSCKFSPSNVSVAFEGTSKPTISFKCHKSSVECMWRPPLPGVYKVMVRYMGEDIPGSPFICQVGGDSSHLTDPHITVHGEGLCNGCVGGDNEVIIENVAGFIGGLNASIEGPGKPKMSFKTNQGSNSVSLIYRVGQPGLYKLSILFTNQHVKGSPFNINVT